MTQPQVLEPRFDSPAENWLFPVFRQLAAIEQLPDGWDSRSGKAPDPELLKAGGALIAAAYQAVPTLPKPQVHPTPSGGVQFQWEHGERYFEIEVVEPRVASYYYVDHSNGTEAEGELQVGDSLVDALRYVRSLAVDD